MKIAIIVIHYNTPHYLKTCIPSILNQTHSNLELIFIDNNSPDNEGLMHMHEHYDHDPRVTIIANQHNTGYAAAANQGINIAKSRDCQYLAITNPDIIYTPEYFQLVLERIQHAPRLAAITGKVYKYDFSKMQETDIIDTVGLKALKSRRIVDDGQGIVDQGQFAEEHEIFGISGACPFYRLAALESVAYAGQYFDEDFFMYKEDVDLAWRLKWAGWKSLFLPQAIAYHGRGTGVLRRATTGEVLNGRSALNKFQKQYGFRNQLLMQFKNEAWGTFLRDLPYILLIKILTPFYITFFEPYLWSSYFAYLRLLPKFIAKRRHAMQQRRLNVREMSKWFKAR